MRGKAQDSAGLLINTPCSCFVTVVDHIFIQQTFSSCPLCARHWLRQLVAVMNKIGKILVSMECVISSTENLKHTNE